jgi:hypothetical protein
MNALRGTTFEYVPAGPVGRYHKEFVMKRQVIGVLASVLAASALIAARSGQATANPPAQTPSQTMKSGADVTVTGCLTQGSSPAVFILSNAKQKPDDKNEKGQSYVVVAASEDLPFVPNLNHEVSVTGSTDAKVATPPAVGGKLSETDLPRFSAKNVTVVADRCTAATR